MMNIDKKLLDANKGIHPEVFEKVYERAVEEKVARRYSIERELSILRQRDRKPEEFAEYDAYVEQCKAEVKRELGLEV